MTYGCITDRLYDDHADLEVAAPQSKPACCLAAYLRAFDNDDDECDDKWEAYGL